MTAQILDRLLRCYRLGEAEGQYPVFGAAGSRLFPGRWNDVGHGLIYTEEQRLPFEVRTPDADTARAIKEIDSGKGKRFESAEALFEDLGL